jgi:DNA-binding response OmpR family regulator
VVGYAPVFTGLLQRFTVGQQRAAAGTRHWRAMDGIPEGGVVRIGEMEIRADEGYVMIGGRVVPMSARELGLLHALGTRAGRTVSREDLYRIVWGSELRRGDRSIDVYISKVRAKLEEALPGWRYIHTHVGFGYRLWPEAFTGLSHGRDRAVTP